MPAAKEPFSFDPAKYDLERTIGAAGNFLNQFRPFQDFLRSIRQGAEITPYQTNDPFDLGIFELPRSDQMLIDKDVKGNVASNNVRVNTVSAPISSRLRSAGKVPTNSSAQAGSDEERKGEQNHRRRTGKQGASFIPPSINTQDSKHRKRVDWAPHCTEGQIRN